MNIKIVKDSISIDELKEIAKEFYYPMIKGVVDIETGTAAFGGEYHADAREKLLSKGLKSENIWGFNIYLDKDKDSGGWIEYIALINIKPGQNSSMEIQNEEIKSEIRKIIEKLVK